MQRWGSCKILQLPKKKQPEVTARGKQAEIEMSVILDEYFVCLSYTILDCNSANVFPTLLKDI